MTRHTPNRLNPRSLDKLPAGRHGDGHGMHLFVRTTGTRSWVQRLVVQGERVDMALGGYPLVSLKEAREVAFANRQAARRGEDPRRNRVPTFAQCETVAYAEKRGRWCVSGREDEKWRRSMDRDVLPRIGTVRMDQLEARHLKAALLPIAQAGCKPDRAANRISQVLEHARVDGHYASENPCTAVLRHLRGISVAPATKHMRALPHAEVAAALAKVAAHRSPISVRLALRFVALTAARGAEVRTMEWSDVDTDAAVWNRPGSKMKSRKAHSVPLSRQALDLLIEARALTDGTGYVFPGTSGMLADTAMRKLATAAKIGGTVHGMRSSFRDWCGEMGVAREVAEASLAHAMGDETERAYARSDLLERRRETMQAWGEYIAP